MILAECRLSEIYGKKVKESCEIIEKMKGKALEGIEYEPLFDAYIKKAADGCFRVIAADYVSSDAGTGVVHNAPSFGEDDYKVCTKAGIVKPDNIPEPLDENGNFND